MPKHNKSEIVNHVKLVYSIAMENKLGLVSQKDKQDEYERMMKIQEQRIGDLEKIAHSQLIWRIEDYSRYYRND